MKNKHKRLIIPLILAVSLMGGIFLLWPKKVSPPKLREGKKANSIPPISALVVTTSDEIIIKNRFGKFILKKINEKWMVDFPVKSAANQRIINNIISRFGGLRFGEVVTSDPKTFRKYNITKRKAVSISFKSKGKLQKELLLGSSKKFTLIREAGKNSVWNHKGALRQFLVRDTKGWIESNLVPYTLKDVVGVEYFDNKGNPTLKFKKEKGSKFIPADGKTIPGFYGAMVTRAVIKLLKVRIKKINNNKGKKASYFTNSIGSIKLNLKKGKSFSLKFGNTEKSLVHVESPIVKWIPMIRAIDVNRLFLSNIHDVMNPFVFKTDGSKIKSITGECKGFFFKIGKEPKKDFKIIEKKVDFILAKSRVKGFFNFLKKGGLRALKVMDKEKLTEDIGINEKSDYILFERDDKTTVKLTFGKSIKHDIAGFARYVISSHKPKLVYLVERAFTTKVCRGKVDWQLASDEMEAPPNKKVFQQ
jgi:Domain of unknown function (DUF4340)